jgi:hypothetical protein
MENFNSILELELIFKFIFKIKGVENGMFPGTRKFHTNYN